MLETETSPVRSTMADDEDFAELLEMFVEGIQEKRSEMTGAFQKMDFDALRKVAHQLKGSGGGYGFAGLSERAASLEESCKQSMGPDVISERLQILLGYMERVSL